MNVHRAPLMAAILGVALSSAQDALPNLQQRILPDLRARRYLPVLAALTAPELAQSNDRFIAEYMLPMVFLWVGDVRKGIELAEGPPPATTPAEPNNSLLNDARPVDALRAIVAEAKNRRVVVINEYHHIPRGRAFTLQLARELRKHGFRYFAAEAFPAFDKDLDRRGYSTAINGYEAEPNFGDLVRQTKKVGYRLVQYEESHSQRTGDPVRDANSRDQAAAENLVDRVFRNDSNAKILIHVGMDHVAEDPVPTANGGSYVMLAAALKQKLGVDPLTIEQAYMTDRSHPAHENPYYRLAERRGLIGPKPVALRNPRGGYVVAPDRGIAGPGTVDMQVFHPRTRMVNGRPDWLAVGGHRRALRIEDSWLPKSRALVQAYVEEEGPDAVPMDQIIVQPGAPKPVLMLPRGRYRIVVQDETGATVRRIKVRR